MDITKKYFSIYNSSASDIDVTLTKREGTNDNEDVTLLAGFTYDFKGVKSITLINGNDIDTSVLKVSMSNLFVFK